MFVTLNVEYAKKICRRNCNDVTKTRRLCSDTKHSSLSKVEEEEKKNHRKETDSEERTKRRKRRNYLLVQNQSSVRDSKR